MAKPQLSQDALKKAFLDASEHFSESKTLEKKLTKPRYKDLELLDEGGAKLIYLTLDQVTGREIVRAYAKSPELEDEFLREATLHAHLEHPNIIPYYDMGLQDDRPFFCMKHINGETLESYVHDHLDALNQAEVRSNLLDAFLKICNATSYAHSQDILHLDIKPSNIQLSSFGEVLLGDWGLARTSLLQPANHPTPPSSTNLQSTGQFTRHGYLSGTPGFMAPEQCTKGEQKTPQTDIYALGALLVYILTGTAPITGTSEQIMAATPIGKWSFSLDSIPLGLRPVVSKALALEQSDRYTSVEGLNQDINAYRSGYLTSAEEFTSKRLIQTLYRRNKTIINTIAAAFAILLAVSIIFIQRLKSSEQTALLAKKDAVAEQENTQEALELFQQAQHEKNKQGKDFAKNYLRESANYHLMDDLARYTFDQNTNKRAYQLVNRALELQPDNLKAWALKGKLAMLNNQLADAILAFKKAGGKYDLHREVCLLFIDKDINNPRVLSQMLWKLIPSKDLRLIHDFMYQTIYDKSIPHDDLIFFIEESLNMRNLGEQSRLNFTYDRENQTLDMSGNKQLQFIFMIKNLPLKEVNFSNTSISSDFYHLALMPLVKVNVAHTAMNNHYLKNLTGRPIRELILTGCPVSDLSPLRDCPLEIIDIRHTKIKDFSEFAHYKELKKVICTPNQRTLLRQAHIREELIETPL